MNTSHPLRALLNNTATEEDIALLKRLLASGEISIGGNVNNSTIIKGSGNNVQVFQLTTELLELLDGRKYLGNIDRDLTGEEIASGLRRLEKLLPNRAPVLLPQFKAAAARLRPTLKTDVKALSQSARRERLEALASVNSICVEAVDVSFNGLALGEAAPDYDARSPFRGLESFRPEDSEFFFGREALTQKLVGKIKANSFLAVLGASGSGKSSLVMAGVIPALDLDYAIFRPGTNPLGELESARGKSLIVVDQFEELFTLTRDESAREEFIARLLAESSRAKIILTLRSDFLAEVGTYRTLSAEIQNHLEIIPPMDVDELRRAMEGQAGVTGLRFEADLSQQIIDDVAGEPGSMPLLQHALWELWNRRHGRNLRASEYRAFGGVKQAITSTAEQVYADCSKTEQDALRDIFMRLTRLDDGDEGRDTRRRVPLGDLIPSGRDAASITLLLDKLANARLVVKTVNDDKTEVEVAHEALIRHWERLRIWLNEDRDALRLREGIIDAAKLWEVGKRDDTLLIHRAGRLDDAISLSKDLHYGLTDVEQAYLKECVAYQKGEQNRRERFRRQIIIGLGTGFLIVLVISIIAGFQWQKAEEKNKIATARQLAAQANELYKEKPDLALLLSLQSLNFSTTVEGRSALLRWIDIKKLQLAELSGHKDIVFSLKFDPLGRFLASSGDKRIILWDITNPKSPKIIGQPLSGHTDVTRGIDISDDGELLASASFDKTVIIWNIKDPEKTFVVSKLIGHQFNIIDVDFNPTQKILVSGDGGDYFILWDISKPTEPKSIGSPNAITQWWINDLSFSPDGKTLATATSAVRLWDISNPEKPKLIEINAFFDDPGGVSPSAIAFSNDGLSLASAYNDTTITLWDISNISNVYPFGTFRSIHTAQVTDIAFSPDSQMLASSSEDRTIQLYDVSNTIAPRPIGSPLATGSKVYSIAFSPDSTFLASGQENGNIILWDLSLEHWRKLGCEKAGRNLTRPEWEQYIGDALPYQAVCPNLPIEPESTPTP